MAHQKVARFYLASITRFAVAQPSAASVVTGTVYRIWHVDVTNTVTIVGITVVINVTRLVPE